MSALPHQTSISPVSISQGTANSFFVPSGAAPPPPPPPSTIADVVVSSITFTGGTPVFPTSSISIYRAAAAAAGGGGFSSTLVGMTNTLTADSGIQTLGIYTLSTLGVATSLITGSLVGTSTTTIIGGGIFNELAFMTAPMNVTLSTLNASTINDIPYRNQPLIQFGQGVIPAGSSTIVTLPVNYSTGNSYVPLIGGAPSTFVFGFATGGIPSLSSFGVYGPAGSNFNWMTVATTQ